MELVDEEDEHRGDDEGGDELGESDEVEGEGGVFRGFSFADFQKRRHGYNECVGNESVYKQLPCATRVL